MARSACGCTRSVGPAWRDSYNHSHNRAHSDLGGWGGWVLRRPHRGCVVVVVWRLGPTVHDAAGCADSFGPRPGQSLDCHCFKWPPGGEAPKVARAKVHLVRPVCLFVAAGDKLIRVCLRGRYLSTCLPRCAEMRVLPRPPREAAGRSAARAGAGCGVCRGVGVPIAGCLAALSCS